jgi:hypothetical protein
LETQTSFIVFGKRGDHDVVLKVIRQPGDEWRSGAVMVAFGAWGMARVYEHIEGALLLERLNPGLQLAGVALDGRDEEATKVLADVIDRMSLPFESSDEPSREALKAFVSAQDWGKGFDRYLASGDSQIPTRLVAQARQLYFDLCVSQRSVRLLHGDLQHYNVLFDSERGWLAIDPKGVPTMDKNGDFYFVSTRSYKETLSTIYHGRFSGGSVTAVKIVDGVSEKALGRVNFDVEVNADGLTLYFVDGVFSGKPTPDKADIAIAVRGDAGFRRLSGSAELLKNVNTDALEYAACVSQDELELFFTRAGKGAPAIYRSTRKNATQPFDSPVRIAAIKGFVEAPAISPDGRSLYYHLKEGERFVIYRVTRSL